MAIIGMGAFSKVYRGICEESGEEVAMKVVYRHKSNVKACQWQVLRNEALLLSQISHQNIVELKEYYEDDKQLVMILEMLKGGEVLEHLKTITKYSEKAAAALFRQQLSALAHLHTRGIIHRDIKPENIMIHKAEANLDDGFGAEDGDDGSSSVVKLIDLGMACRLSDTGAEPRGVIGTVGFVAPEVCGELPHSPAMDIWSMGVMLYSMLCGNLPYTNSQLESMDYVSIPFEQSQGFFSDEFNSLSDSAREMIMQMLTLCPERRATAKELLRHTWLSQATSPGRPLLSSVSAGARQIAEYRSNRGMSNCVVVHTDDSESEVGIDSARHCSPGTSHRRSSLRSAVTDGRIGSGKLRFDPEKFTDNFHDDGHNVNNRPRAERPRRARRMGQVMQWSESLRVGLSSIASKSKMRVKSGNARPHRIKLVVDGDNASTKEDTRRVASASHDGSRSPDNQDKEQRQVPRRTGSSIL